MPDETASRFIRENYEAQDRLALVLISRSRDGGVRHQFRSAEEIASRDCQKYLEQANVYRKDVYLSTNALNPGAQGRTKADIGEVRHLYIDLDTGGKAAVERILKEPGLPNPHHVLETSPDKFQVLWSVRGFSKEEAERAVQGLNQRFGGDAAVHDVARILRVPGFHNHKYDVPHVVRDVHPHPPMEREYWREDFPKYEIERQRQFSEARTHMAVQSVRGGSQSERDFAWACRHLERGENSFDLQRQIAQYRGSEKFRPDDYARRTVEAAERKVQQPQPERAWRER
jgi:hypothetical protein